LVLTTSSVIRYLQLYIVPDFLLFVDSSYYVFV
jgi:hypothetical protein